jgi:ubiquitin conjugation factor E4 B
VLSQIFRIAVDPHNMGTAGQRVIFLPNLNAELNESREPLKLTTGNLDQAILEAAGTWPPNKPLMDYLLPCWKRALKSATSLKNASPRRVEIHEEAKRLAISNCLFSVTLPELYGRENNPDIESLVPYVLRGVFDENGLDLDFYKEAIAKFDDDDALPELFNDTMIRLSSKLSKMSMEDDYKPYVQVNSRSISRSNIPRH